MRRFFAIVLGVVLAGPALAARNAGGTYSLAAGNPVTVGKIQSSWANNTLGDIATELTDSLSRSGKGAMLAPVRTPDGTAAAPTWSFTSETGTGVYRIGASDVGLSISGTKRAEWTAAGYAVDAIRPLTAATAITVNGNQAAGAVGTDVIVNSVATRTAGSILDVQNNGTSKFRVGAVVGTAITPSASNLSQYVYITADQTVTSNTLVDVTGMAFAVAANADYEFEGYVPAVVTGANGGSGGAFTGPAAPTFLHYVATQWCVSAYGGVGTQGGTVQNAFAPSNFYLDNSGNNVDCGTRISGVLRNGANAGTVQLQAAKQAANTNIIIKQGAWLRVRRMDAPY